MNKREVTRFSREEIANRVKELGQQIAKDYANKELVAIGLLRGSFVFLADLVREIDHPIVVDFITTSSYEHSEISTGTVNILSDLRENIEGKDVLIVDVPVLTDGRQTVYSYLGDFFALTCSVFLAGLLCFIIINKFIKDRRLNETK